MDAPSLTLIGSAHRSDGGTKLREFLSHLCPEIVTLEMSPYALFWRRRKGVLLLNDLETILEALSARSGRSLAEIRAHPEVRAILSLLHLPFEYAEASRYAEDTGFPLELIDSSLISARKLRRVETELVTEKNLEILVTLPPAEPVENSRLAKRLVHDRVDPAIRRAFLSPRRGPEGIGDRDRRMAAVIRRLAVEKRLVHIGGWVHLVEDDLGETLYSRLRDLHPKRVVIGGEAGEN